MEGVTVVAEAGDDGFVAVFGLAVGLRVVGGGHVALGAGGRDDGFPEVGGETGVSVGDEGFWPTVEAVDVVVEELGEAEGVDGGGARGDVKEFGETADKEGEGVVAAGGEGEVGDKVERDGGPRAVGDGEGLEEPGGGEGCAVFAGLARGAGVDVGGDGVLEARPVEVLLKPSDGLLDAEMAGDRDVVGFLEERGVEGGGEVEAVGGGVEEVIEEDEVGAVAFSDGLEGALVGGVVGGFAPDVLQERGGDGVGGADGVEV